VTTELIEPTISVHEGDILDGRYCIERRLGGGGMGVVWAAKHVHLNTRVAIKFPQPQILQNPDAVRRFMREARAAANIKSEHVARVLDVAVLSNGIPYQVIEYLEGGDLRARLRQKGRFEVAQAVDFVLQTCEAIAEAHTIGIVHRDLKPENLFCTPGKDGQPFIKVLDFGISKVLQDSALSDGAGDTAMTRVGALMGSPLYMSPEHLQSAREVDARTDIWSLGVILYELLTGRVPFTGEILPELAINVATQLTPSVRNAEPAVSPELDAIVARCLQKQREQRYNDVNSFAEALSPFAPAATGRQFERPVRVAASEHDSCATLVPEVAPGAVPEPQSIQKTSPTVGTWEKSASVKPSWTRVLPWSAVALAGLSLAGFLGIRSLHTHPDPLQPVTAPTGSMPAEPVRDQATSAPRIVPETTAHRLEASPVPLQAADAGAVAINRAPTPRVLPPLPSTARVLQPAKRAPRPQVNCNPNYEYDENGEKRFKPECF
jgi:serine/threonine-protein kinase